MSHAQRRRALLDLAKCAGWTEIVLPLFRNAQKNLETAILADDCLTGVKLDEARAQRRKLEEIFDLLQEQAYAAFHNLTVEEQTQTPRSALHEVILPALSLRTPNGSPSAPPPAKPALAAVEFPPMHLNPFDPANIPAKADPPDSPSTAS